jgi:AraC-like DNA-binding protein
MSEPELFIRVVAFTEFSALSLLLLRNRTDNRAYFYTALLFLGVAAYILAPPIIEEWQWSMAVLPVILLAGLVPTLFWYFTGAVFVDDFRAPPWAALLAIATALAGLLAFCTGAYTTWACELGSTPVPDWIAQAAKMIWLAAAVVTVLRDWRDDLVESRRRLRHLLIIAGGIYMAVILVVEILIPGPAPEILEFFNAILLLALATGLLLHFLGIRKANVLSNLAAPAAQAGTPSSPLAEQLVELMERDRAFATDALTISGLAARLSTQPHRLRKVINGELGYRNFNTFINLCRVREIAGRLGQEEYRDTPLLTLALDAGFRSLAPFNRTFREHFGVTPSEYRKKLQQEK